MPVGILSAIVVSFIVFFAGFGFLFQEKTKDILFFSVLNRLGEREGKKGNIGLLSLISIGGCF